jgi:hypothetical protein
MRLRPLGGVRVSISLACELADSLACELADLRNPVLAKSSFSRRHHYRAITPRVFCHCWKLLIIAPKVGTEADLDQS